MPPLAEVIDTLVNVVLPALLAASLIVALAVLAFGRRSADPGAVIGLFAGCLTANYFCEALPPLRLDWLGEICLPLPRPREMGWNWLLYAGLLAALIGFIAHLQRVPA